MYTVTKFRKMLLSVKIILGLFVGVSILYFIGNFDLMIVKFGLLGTFLIFALFAFVGVFLLSLVITLMITEDKIVKLYRELKKPINRHKDEVENIKDQLRELGVDI